MRRWPLALLLAVAPAFAASSAPVAAPSVSSSTVGAPSLSTAAAPAPVSLVHYSTATGERIEYNDETGTVQIEGHAFLDTASGTVKADRIVADLNAKTAHAEGGIVITNSTGTITAERGFYNWAASTGTVYEFTAANPPWYVHAGTATQKSLSLFVTDDVGVTSCDLEVPHYVVYAHHAKYVPGKRATLYNARFRVGGLPVFWSPIYSRSLVPKKYKLRIEPGASGRDGLITKTYLGYPFTANTYTRFRWDWYERTGNGFGVQHQYNNPNIRGLLDAYYIRDTNPDPEPQQRKYTLLWNHFERFTPRLTGNATVNYESNQEFGNQFTGVGNGSLVENAQRGLTSNAGFSYQFSKASLVTEFDRKDRFDSSISSHAFISKLTLPRFTLDTIPLSWKYFPIYTSFSAHYTNETTVQPVDASGVPLPQGTEAVERTSPEQTLRYRREGAVGVQLRKDIRLAKRTTLVPTAGYSQAWQDRDLSIPDSDKDVYVGRYSGGFSLRQRLNRYIDGTFGFDYAARLAHNRLNLDAKANDRGVETRRLTSSVVSRIGRSTRLSLSSGYDLLAAPRDRPDFYRYRNARLIPPTLDVQVQVNDVTRVYYRETYSLLNPTTRTPEATPAATSGEIEIGDTNSLTYFSQGFTFTKEPPGSPSQINFNNRLRFFLTQRWYVNLLVSYAAFGRGDLDYRTVKPVERSIAVVRDLHCWVFSMRFSQRPGVTEASFHIDLKANLTTQRDIFRQEGGVAPGEVDEAAIFPGRNSFESTPGTVLSFPSVLTP